MNSMNQLRICIVVSLVCLNVISCSFVGVPWQLSAASAAGDLISTQQTGKTLSENVSIRKGKYGPYVMVKKPGLKKPIFLKIKDKNIDEITIDWVNDNLL